MVNYQKILFICTGNFYRSRFAEAVFNHDATRRNLPWRAFSRGLGIHLADGNLSLPSDSTSIRSRSTEVARHQ